MVKAVCKRTIVVIFFSLGLLLAARKQGNAQRTAVNLQQQVNIPADRLPLDSLLQVVSKQTGVKFSVNTRKFPLSRAVTIKRRKQTVAALLGEIRASTKMDYTFVGGHIIFVDAVAPLPKKAIAVIAGKLPVKSPAAKRDSPEIRAAFPSTLSAEMEHTTKLVAEIPAPASFNATAPSVGPFYNVTRPEVFRTKLARLTANAKISAARNLRLSAAAVAGSGIGSGMRNGRSRGTLRTGVSNWWIKPGVTGDDLLFVHTTLHAGHSLLYGILSWSTDFRNSGYRYGAGVSIPLNEQWRLHGQFTTGRLWFNKDSLQVKRSLVVDLHKVAIMAEIRIGRKWSLQAGPVLNIMRTKFVQDKSAINFVQELSEIRKIYGLIKPQYTLSNNYNPNASKFTSSWIGAQIGIYYNFYLFKRQ